VRVRRRDETACPRGAGTADFVGLHDAKQRDNKGISDNEDERSAISVPSARYETARECTALELPRIAQTLTARPAFLDQRANGCHQWHEMKRKSRSGSVSRELAEVSASELVNRSSARSTAAFAESADSTVGGKAADFGGTREQNWIQRGGLKLPAPPADLFIAAGAIVAERAAHDGASRSRVEDILRRAGDQAAALG
jgi:hypothetical protein